MLIGDTMCMYYDQSDEDPYVNIQVETSKKKPPHKPHQTVRLPHINVAKVKNKKSQPTSMSGLLKSIKEQYKSSQ